MTKRYFKILALLGISILLIGCGKANLSLSKENTIETTSSQVTEISKNEDESKETQVKYIEYIDGEIIGDISLDKGLPVAKINVANSCTEFYFTKLYSYYSDCTDNDPYINIIIPDGFLDHGTSSLLKIYDIHEPTNTIRGYHSDYHIDKIEHLPDNKFTEDSIKGYYETELGVYENHEEKYFEPFFYIDTDVNGNKIYAVARVEKSSYPDGIMWIWQEIPSLKDESLFLKIEVDFDMNKDIEPSKDDIKDLVNMCQLKFEELK